MEIKSQEKQDGSLEIHISFSSEEVSCLKHDLPGIQGIVEWYSKGPSAEKIHRCKERMHNEMIPKLRAKGMAIPATDSELISMILKDEDYKDRAAREIK